MTHNELRLQILTVIASTLGVDAAGLRDITHLRDDLKVDSLDRLDLQYRLETALNCDVPDEVWGGVVTVGDAVTIATVSWEMAQAEYDELRGLTRRIQAAGAVA